mmetsp:Transcript_84323/g.176496  ORF Transcript_84323/g.176496 Transcript_84323/m.176496 type:complete len:203 (+) Transcript_84323:1458-2066(+)
MRRSIVWKYASSTSSLWDIFIPLRCTSLAQACSASGKICPRRARLWWVRRVPSGVAPSPEIPAFRSSCLRSKSRKLSSSLSAGPPSSNRIGGRPSCPTTVANLLSGFSCKTDTTSTLPSRGAWRSPRMQLLARRRRYMRQRFSAKSDHATGMSSLTKTATASAGSTPLISTKRRAIGAENAVGITTSDAVAGVPPSLWRVAA